MFASHLLDEWKETDPPSIDRRMVDRHATRFQHFLDVPVAQRISRLPSNADQDDFDRETHSFKVEHAVPPKFR